MNDHYNYCSYCGNPLQPNMHFCAKCGKEVAANRQEFNAGQNLSTGQNLQSGQYSHTEQVPQAARLAQVGQLVQPSLSSQIPQVTKPKSRRKVWIALGTVSGLVLIVAAVLLVFGVNGGGRDRLIMLYMIGSDLESKNAAGSLDITEIKNSSFDSEHTKVLVYTGGSSKWALDEISADENAIFEISNGSLNKIQTYKKQSMTDSDTLKTFIDYGYNNYKTDLYDLILWDHGGGPIFGYGLDDDAFSEKPMKMLDLAKWLAESQLLKDGKKFELIGFDACLMGSAEVAKILLPYADYMIASEEVEPGKGWNYGFLSDFTAQKTIDTKEMGQNIIDRYVSSYEDYYYNVDLSLSMIDLSKVAKLSDAVDVLFSTVKNEITSQSFSQYSRIMTRDKVYGYDGRDNQSYDLVDLMDLCGSLRDGHNDEVGAIEQILRESVVYNRSNMENTNGLSIYFLNYNRALAEELLVSYADVAFSDGYFDFLTKYKDYVTSEKLVSRAVYNDLEEKKTDTGIQIELTDELRDNYQNGEIVIYRKLGENKFMPVYRSSEVELNGNTMKVTSYKLQFVVEVSKGGGTEYGWTTLVEKERTAEYADYVAYGVLWYDNGGAFLTPESFEMFVRVPNGSSDAQIRDIRVESKTEVASKMSFDPQKIDIIEFVSGTYRLFNDAGDLDYNMSSWGNLYGIGANLGDGDSYKIKLVGLNFDFGDMFGDEFSNLTDYYAGFVVHDTQGDTHRLNLVHIDQ